jgi:hypothetical protein
MATVTKVTSGSTTTYTVTDAQGNAATLAVLVNPVTGNVITYGGAAVHNDATAMISQLLLQLRTGLLPGAGAQNLQP